MKVTAIIPARLASTRLPRKPLTLINGKALIMHVYDRVKEIEAIDRVIIATDDQTILKVAQDAGAEAILTNINHQSGTDRIAEVANLLNIEGVVLNIQGDEPLVSAELINPIVNAFKEDGVDIVSVCKSLTDVDDINNSNIVKVVKSVTDKALYFSRYAVPFNRDNAKVKYFKHIGVYAFRAQVLDEVVKLPMTMLENSEKLEQLRWLENDYSIKMIETDQETIGIDTPEDVAKYEAYLASYK